MDKMVPVVFTFIRRTVRSLPNNVLPLRNLGRRRTLLLAAMLLSVGYIGYNYFITDYIEPRITLLPIKPEYITEYCNFPVDTSGKEGNLPLDTKGNKLSLEMVQVMIRHGDRSTARMIEGMEKRDMDCSTEPKHGPEKKLFEGYRKVIERFSVRAMSPDSLPYHELIAYSHLCLDNGQLTKKGYLQHFELGRHLRNAYSQLHVDGVQKEHLYTRSTSYDRTVQSAASFMFGFLELDTIEKGVVLNVSKDTWFREQDSGALQDCPAVSIRNRQNKQTKEYRAGEAAMEPLMIEVASLVMQPRHALPPLPYVADYAYVFSCQGYQLPCGPAGCITKDMAYRLMANANWAFSHNYTGIAEILTHPLLTQIASRMADKSQGKTPIKFALYSGHDSTITPVLVALDVYEQMWIPYASRLVFELWKNSSTMSAGHDNASIDYNNWFLRVLFNGKVVTGKLLFCKGRVPENSELCPLKYFVSWLSGGEGFESIPTRYNQMCH